MKKAIVIFLSSVGAITLVLVACFGLFLLFGPSSQDAASVVEDYYKVLQADNIDQAITFHRAHEKPEEAKKFRNFFAQLDQLFGKVQTFKITGHRKTNKIFSDENGTVFFVYLEAKRDKQVTNEEITLFKPFKGGKMQVTFHNVRPKQK